MLDTNFLIYLYDESSLFHHKSQLILIDLINNNNQLFLTHQIIEEFIHTFLQILKLAKKTKIYKNLRSSLDKINSIPNLTFTSPNLNMATTNKVVNLMEKYGLTSLDAYLLQIILENKIDGLISFDKKLNNSAKDLGLLVYEA